MFGSFRLRTAIYFSDTGWISKRLSYVWQRKHLPLEGLLNFRLRSYGLPGLGCR